MNSEELVTEVDENDNVIGLQPKSSFNEGKLIHRSSYLLVLSSENEVLLQQRDSFKKWHPGKWTFAVTGTVGDETYEECIRRQIKEAFGKKFGFKELFKYRHFDNVDKAFKTVFMAHAEKDDITLNKSYTSNFAWTPLEKLKTKIDTHPEKYAPPFVADMKIAFKQNLL